MKLSKRTTIIKEAAMATMSDLSRKLKDTGVDVVSLSLGEPDFNTPDFIKEAAHNAIEQNYSHYSPLPGFLDLRQAICHKLKRDNNLEYFPNQIVVSTGAKQSIMNALFALIDEGDEVLLPAPYWASYFDMILLAGGIPVVIETNISQGFKLTPEQLQTAITHKTKLLIFNSPNNPGGTYYHSNEVDEISKILIQNPQIFIISDEVYEHFIYVNDHPKSLANYPDLYPRTIVINGASKSFAMTGWRIGYMAAHPEIAKTCDTIQGQITSGPNAIAQRATLEAVLKNPENIDEIRTMRKEFINRRNFVYERLRKIIGIKVLMPEGAFYIFPDISAFFGKKIHGKIISNSTDFALMLLNYNHVSTTPGDAFGIGHCLRLSYANSMDELEKAMNRIEEFVSKIEA